MIPIAAILAAALAWASPQPAAGGDDKTTTGAVMQPLGKPVFDERFATFDHGTDQVRPARPHRWRTVYGYGGPRSISNRQMSAGSFASDRGFAGTTAAGPGARPLGLDPFVHEPGRLVILGRKVPAGLRPLTWNKPYYGGAITSKFSFTQRYGYFEIEAKLPSGKGMWPAFWLMPVDGKWPDAGEIDVFEGLGDPHAIYCTVIAGRLKTTTRVPLQFDAAAGFHRYGVLWGPRQIVWFVDRKRVAQAPTPPALTRKPGYMIANLAVGGAWGGYPDARTRFPGRYEIRRIAVWPHPAL